MISKTKNLTKNEIDYERSNTKLNDQLWSNLGTWNHKATRVKVS